MNNVILIFFGVTAGIVVAAAVFAFLTMIGVLVRLANRTNTAKYIEKYEDMAVLGAGIGNVVIMFDISLPIGTIGLILIGLFSGSFIGCLAVALEEISQVFPVLIGRIKLRIGMPFIVLCLALGKGIGTFFQLYWNR